MRVAFVGKGGSGKTTLSSLFARILADKGLAVLAIDADINQHLGVALGLDPEHAAELPALGAHLTALREHLRGDNRHIATAAQMVKTTPPGRGSRILRCTADDPLLAGLTHEVDGLRLLVTGPFDAADLGVACYHSKTGAVELLLNHMVDGVDEYVVVDMTAGADAFASGLFTRFDLTIMVVEPTRRSVGVFHQYAEYARGYDVRLAAVGNKVHREGDVAFLREHLGDALLTWVDHSDHVRAADRGENRPLDLLEPENRSALEEVRAALDACTRDWHAYQHNSNEFHRRNAAAWGNARVGTDLAAQIDPDFDLATVATMLLRDGRGARS